MEKKQITTASLFSKMKFFYLSLLIVFTTLVIYSFDNKRSVAKKNIYSATQAKFFSKTRPIGQFDLNSLILTAKQQKDLFQNGNSVKQLLFTFDNRGVDGWGLMVSGTNKDGKVLTGPFPLTIVPTSSTPFPAGGNIYNQIITRGNLKDFYGLLTEMRKDRKIKETLFKDIRFTPSPVLGPGNAIFFIVTYSGVKADFNKKHKPFSEGDILTNPSPPAPPACLSNCDN